MVKTEESNQNHYATTTTKTLQASNYLGRLGESDSHHEAILIRSTAG